MKLWIAREKCGNLFLYDTKPYKDGEYWKSAGNYYLIDRHLFLEITFKNSPQEVKLKLIDNETRR